MILATDTPPLLPPLTLMGTRCVGHGALWLWSGLGTLPGLLLGLSFGCVLLASCVPSFLPFGGIFIFFGIYVIVLHFRATATTPTKLLIRLLHTSFWFGPLATYYFLVWAA